MTSDRKITDIRNAYELVHALPENRQSSTRSDRLKPSATFSLRDILASCSINHCSSISSIGVSVVVAVVLAVVAAVDVVVIALVVVVAVVVLVVVVVAAAGCTVVPPCVVAARGVVVLMADEVRPRVV